MANEINRLYINGKEVSFELSDIKNSNVLTYVTSPSRDMLFTLDSETIVHKYIPQLSITIPKMTSDEYNAFVKQINVSHFNIKYYDSELNKEVVREMYCTEFSYEKLWHEGTKYKGVFGINCSFVSLYAYSSYAKLEEEDSRLYAYDGFKLSARIFYKSAKYKINYITSNNSFSDSGTFVGGDIKQMGVFSSGSKMYLLGSSWKDKLYLGKKYNGLILNSYKSQEEFSYLNIGGKSYKNYFSGVVALNINVSGLVADRTDYLFIRFDNESNEFCNHVVVEYADSDTKEFSDNDTLLKIEVKNGINTVYFLDWSTLVGGKVVRMVDKYFKATSITSSFDVVYSSNDYLKELQFGCGIGDNAAGANYGLYSSYGYMTIYDKNSMVKDLAEEGFINSSTLVEIYLGEVISTNCIARFNGADFSYVEGTYNKLIKISFVDSISKLNNISFYTNANLYDDTYKMTNMIGRLQSICNDHSINAQFSSNNFATASPILLDNHNYKVYNLIDYVAKFQACYMYSDALGNIKYMEG